MTSCTPERVISRTSKASSPLSASKTRKPHSLKSRWVMRRTVAWSSTTRMLGALRTSGRLTGGLYLGERWYTSIQRVVVGTGAERDVHHRQLRRGTAPRPFLLRLLLPDCGAIVAFADRITLG